MSSAKIDLFVILISGKRSTACGRKVMWRVGDIKAVFGILEKICIK